MRRPHRRPAHQGLRALALAAVTLVALAACATGPGTPQQPGGSDAAPQAPAPDGTDSHDPGTNVPSGSFDPRDLVGNWSVDDASADSPGTVIQFGTYLTVWRECGMAELQYLVATAGELRAAPLSSSGACNDDDAESTTSLLTAADRLELSGDTLTVHSTDGATATLHRGGEPQVTSDVSPELAKKPTLTPELEAWLVWAPVTLPDGLEAPTSADLVDHRWLPFDPPAANPDGSWAEINADGTWAATDGCNQLGGLWLLSAEGQFRTTSGISTLIGCEGLPVSEWLSKARALGLAADGTLVIFDADGSELGRLHADDGA